MILVDLIMLDHSYDDHNCLILGMRVGLELAGLSLHPQLAHYAVGLLLFVCGEGADVDVEQLMGIAAEEKVIMLEFEVLLKVFRCTDYHVVVTGVEEVRGFLKIFRFVEVDYVFYTVD